MISGDADPDPDLFPTAVASVEHSPGLREQIKRAQRHQLPLWSELEILWMPESDRINSVVDSPKAATPTPACPLRAI